MKQYIIQIYLFLLSASIHSQIRYVDLAEALASGNKLQGKGGLASVNWIHGGDKYSYIEPGKPIIKTNDPATGIEETPFDATGLTFPGTSEVFKYNSFRWASDFKYILFQCNFRPIWRNSGDADYYMYSLQDKKLKLLVKDARTAELSPDGQKVGYEKGGNLYVMNLSTAKSTQLTKDASIPTVVNGRFSWVYEEEFGLVQAWEWSQDSRYIAFWQTIENKVPNYKMSDLSGMHPEYTEIPYPRVGDPTTDVRIGIIDLKTNKNKWANLDLKGGYVPRMYWTSDPGTLAITSLNRAQNHIKLLFAEALTGKTRMIFEEKDDNGWIEPFDFFGGVMHYMHFPSDKKEFYWISGRDEYKHIYRYAYDGRILSQVTKGPWDVVSIDGISDDGKVYYVSTENSPLERHLYSIQNDGTNKKKITSDEGRHRINMSPNCKYYLDVWSNISTPRQVELRHTDGQLLKKYQDNKAVSEYIQTHAYAPRALESVSMPDGQKIDIFVVKPTDFDENKKYPLVMTIYGGPGAQSVYNEWGASGWEQYLAQQGYIVVSVNNRGGGGYGQKFQECVYTKSGQYESYDFSNTALELGKKYKWVDINNMAIQGHSHGGYSTCYTMVTHPDVFKVGIAGAPVTDFRLYDNIFAEMFNGTLAGNEKNYEQASAITHVKNLKGHLLIAHSLMDDNVHVINTYQFIKAATDAGKDVDLRIYPPGNHGVAYSSTSRLTLQTTYMKYLEQHLKKENKTMDIKP